MVFGLYNALYIKLLNFVFTTKSLQCISNFLSVFFFFQFDFLNQVDIVFKQKLPCEYCK